MPSRGLPNVTSVRLLSDLQTEQVPIRSRAVQLTDGHIPKNITFPDLELQRKYLLSQSEELHKGIRINLRKHPPLIHHPTQSEIIRQE